VKVGGKLKEIKRNRHLVVPSIKINNNELSPNQLSEGTFKTLALIYYILTDDSKILLVEEPEVCIHHGLLSSIMQLIKIQSKLKQIIISTHSDFVRSSKTGRSLTFKVSDKVEQLLNLLISLD
jgi:predicted ATPase